jgi:hypothetical protein
MQQGVTTVYEMFTVAKQLGVVGGSLFTISSNGLQPENDKVEKAKLNPSSNGAFCPIAV